MSDTIAGMEDAALRTPLEQVALVPRVFRIIRYERNKLLLVEIPELFRVAKSCRCFRNMRWNWTKSCAGFHEAGAGYSTVFIGKTALLCVSSDVWETEIRTIGIMVG